jgi:hypothetical protein
VNRNGVPVAPFGTISVVRCDGGMICPHVKYTNRSRGIVGKSNCVNCSI